VPPVEVVQPKPKPPVTAAAPKPKPKPVAKKPAPLPPAPRVVRAPEPVIPPDFGAQIAPIGIETEGSVMGEGTLVPIAPVPGANLPLNKVPSGVSIVNSSDFARENYVDTASDILQQRVPGIILDDLQGNVFQTNIQFRGFESSPVNGVSQGLAVYQNGVRINESFSDIVNYDFLPQVALENIAVVSNNPAYGLNALGGAIVIDMKDGFSYQGGEVVGNAGSFGRYQGSVQAGARAGYWGAYFGGERITDAGYRDFSNSEIRRMYADLGFKNSTAELHFNVTAADNFVGVTAAAPVQLLAVDWSRTFTSPQTTDNEVVMPAFQGTIKLNENTNLTGLAYYRWFKQGHDDGNISEAEDCLPGQGIEGTLCIEGEQLLDQTGNPIPDDVFGGKPLGVIDRTSQDAESWGTALQAVNKAPLFGRNNQFLIGTSYDHGNVDFGAGSELGFFKPRFVVEGGGIFLSSPDEVEQKDIGTQNDYYGLYFSDSFDVTDRLTVTAGGRYNYARIEIRDQSGNAPELDGTNQYVRFNPAGGATYKINPNVSLYGGYSEANRAPIAAELACSDPENPCLIESFLVADPHLDQVVSHTWELGIRGEKAMANRKVEWSLGGFRTENTDDIVTIFSPIAGRGVFENGGDTLRQGIEANFAYRTSRWFMYTNYAFVLATYETPLELAAPDNPFATPCKSRGVEEEEVEEEEGEEEVACIFVQPGDRIPGVPEHRFKLGMDYWITPKWKFGGDFIAVSNQIFFQDDSNLNDPLGGYGRLDLHTSYDLTPRIQLFGLVNNVFDNHYGVFGTFFNLEAADNGARADKQLGEGFFTNPRTITPAPPTTAYGGVKIKLW
jgi:outer membrane receptor protein involved in Fe transport